MDPDKTNTPKSDVKPDSKVEVASSSTTVGETLGDFVKKELASPDQTTEVESETTTTTEESPTPVSTEGDGSPETEVQAETQDETPQDQPAETPVEENKPVPYARFKEVNEKRRELEQRFAEHDKVLSDPEVKAAIDILNLIRTNPARALEQLEPLVNQLKQIKGEAFPADIAEMLEEGTITKDVAVELTKLRHQASASTRALENEKMSTQQRHQSSIVQTWATWDAEHRKTDPDFQPGQKKWDLVNKLLDAEVRRTGFPPTSSDAIKLVESIYADVNALVSAAQPKKPVRKVLTSTSTSAGSTQLDPTKMSLKEFVKAGL